MMKLSLIYIGVGIVTALILALLMLPSRESEPTLVRGGNVATFILAQKKATAVPGVFLLSNLGASLQGGSDIAQ